MRLFRRSLHCLVGGVTAVGAAGWALRPRPRWTVQTPGPFRLIVGGWHEFSNDDPIWIESDAFGAAAYRVEDGTLLLQVPPPDPMHTIADFRALPGGRLAIAPNTK